MIYDFHMHTFFSDGALSPVELARRAIINGYKVLSFTDHAGPSNLESLITQIRKDRDVVEAEWGVTALIGIELTHVPSKTIGKLAEEAKKLGADIVVVHGESPVEPVEHGTNRASVECPFVDVLAHPGLLTVQEAEIAKNNNVFLEITSRKGHSLGNGNVLAVARSAGALLLINSDTHAPSDIHTEVFIRTVGLGAGMTEAELKAAMQDNPLLLLKKLGKLS